MLQDFCRDSIKARALVVLQASDGFSYLSKAGGGVQIGDG